MTVGIVCDSTADLLPAYHEEHDVLMVPLKVRFGEEVFEDWLELHPEEFYERLAASPEPSKTSQPSPAEFEAAYRRLAERGCDSIVSIHLSTALSGTHESAVLAAASSRVPVHLIDTKLVSQGTALVVRAAVRARDAGATGEEVADAARRVTSETRLFFVLDTLEYLVKGGRAGKAAGLAAALLNIKPVLRLDEAGEVAPFKKVKGFRKALSELAAHVAEDAAGRPVRLGLLHSCAPERAEELRQALLGAGVRVTEEEPVLVGAVIGTYAGPNAAGCAYYPEA
ncbi:MAG: DegV family protein [Coriobacteriia bacterium]|nr:DegV family protein [Coriobacteriia bacterium]